MAAVERLRRDCVDAKESLSWDTDTVIPVALPNQRTEVRLTRAEFEDMVRPTLVDTIEALQRSLSLRGHRGRPAEVGAARGRVVAHPARRADAGHRAALSGRHRRPPQARGRAGRGAAGGRRRRGDRPAGRGALPTLEPTQVTRSSRTTVTSPAGVAVPAGVDESARRSPDDDPDDAYGTRLPTAREQRPSGPPPGEPPTGNPPTGRWSQPAGAGRCRGGGGGRAGGGRRVRARRRRWGWGFRRRARGGRHDRDHGRRGGAATGACLPETCRGARRWPRRRSPTRRSTARSGTSG